MNQARQAFERFEKSDSWLPVIFLSLIGIGGTIGIVTLASRLTNDNVRLATNLFFSSGHMLGQATLHHTSGKPLGGDEITNVEIDGLAKIQGWGKGFSYIAAFDWTPTWAEAFVAELELSEAIDESKAAELDGLALKALCWISDDERSLLVTLLATEVGESGPIGSQLTGVQILSIESETGKHLITADNDSLPEAPWESVVSLGKPGKVESEAMFTAHADHVAGKSLQKISTDQLGEFMLKELRRKANWLIQRGGLTLSEIDGLLGAVIDTYEDYEPNSSLSLALKLGFMAGFSGQASMYALDSISDEVADGDLVAIHPCSHFLELESAITVTQRPYAMELLMGEYDLSSVIDMAKQQGAGMTEETNKLIQRIEAQEYTTLLSDIEKPFKAKIYKLNEEQGSENDGPE